MLALLSKTWRPLAVVIFALATFLGAYFYFYRDGYDPPATAEVPFDQITAPSSSFGDFADVPPARSGMLLVDGAHRNSFTTGEIGALLSRVSDRGYEIEFVGAGSRFGFTSIGARDRLIMLDEKLRQADSLAVILPTIAYDEDEADAIEEFVRKGGKLLLIADPTRSHEINSLAGRFGIAFRPDYLYNTSKYDINFQNIFISDFRADEVTDGLHQIVLYTAGSIEAPGPGLAVADGNTDSTLVRRTEPFYPMVKAADGRVLAIGDLTFMVPPQNSIVDNDRLVSNIADYLTDSTRKFELADFPHFFKSEVDILLGQAEQFELGTSLKRVLATFLIDSEFRGIEDIRRDTVFLALYDSSAVLVQYLEVAGIQVNDTIRTPFTPDLATENTGIILLHRTKDRHVMVVLADSAASLADLVNRLASGQFRSGLVSELLSVVKTR